MSNKKLSSVEWFVNQITTKYDKHFAEFYKSEIEQAKELHKEEIMDAYKADLHPCSDEDAKEYYEQVFNQEEK